MSLNSIRTILVPTDFSAHAAEAVRWATDLALRVDAGIVLLHVQQPPVAFTPEVQPFLPDPDLLRASLVEQLEEVRREVQSTGLVRVEARVVDGVPFAEIVRFARDAGAGLIVIGTHGRTGLSHALLGSVAEKVLRKAPCPVLAIRLPQQRFEHP